MSDQRFIILAAERSSRLAERKERRIQLRPMVMLGTKDISKLLVGIPKGAWVALSKNEERVMAYAVELQDAINKSKLKGENDPVVIRVPETDGSTLIL